MRGSSPTSAWTRLPSPPRCCTTPSRTPRSSLERLTRQFGELVGIIVDGVTKLDKVKTPERADAAEAARAAQSETIRKMVVAMARDPRVLVVKLADRLHNMRTLRFLPPHKQERKARETLEIYAPLAHRLGMNTVKWELEDLAFATLYPKRYEEIVRLVSERQPSRDTYLATVTAQVANQLRDAKIKSSVSGRPKHYYSIYQKMIVRERDFADIYDLVGVRVLVDSVRDCYATLGHHPRELAAGSGPVQGLHRDAQVQHVPVAAHDGDRPRGQAGRAADPHPSPCTSAPSTASLPTGSTRKARAAATSRRPRSTARAASRPTCRQG